jgi:hypothetical protein
VDFYVSYKEGPCVENKSLLDRMSIEIERFKLLCNVTVVICIMPMLEAMCELIKFAQSHLTFACDFVVALKMYSVYLYRLYFDPKRVYNDERFKSFINLVDYNNGELMPTWSIDIAINI